MKLVEKYYKLGELSSLVGVSVRTLQTWMHAGEFGDGVINLGSAAGPDYRVAASAWNNFAERRKVTCPEGIAARSVGELRRKAAEQEEAA